MGNTARLLLSRGNNVFLSMKDRQRSKDDGSLAVRLGCTTLFNLNHPSVNTLSNKCLRTTRCPLKVTVLTNNRHRPQIVHSTSTPEGGSSSILFLTYIIYKNYIIMGFMGTCCSTVTQTNRFVITLIIVTLTVLAFKRQSPSFF